LLKIAYECCAEMFPEYENDPLGRLYAEILHDVAYEVDGAIERLDEVKFEGNGLQDPLEPLLSQFIDYTNNKRHIIVLFNHAGHLYCLVKVFEMFSQLIQMSDAPYLKDEDIRLYINDFSKYGCELLTLQELVARLIEEKTTDYKFDEQGMALLAEMSEEAEAGFHANKYSQNLVYNQKGCAIMTEDMLKEIIPEGRISDSSLSGGEITTTYSVPEGFYFCVSPADALVQLKEIQETTVIHKY